MTTTSEKRMIDLLYVVTGLQAAHRPNYTYLRFLSSYALSSTAGHTPSFFFFFLKKLHTNVPFLNGVQLTITSVLTKKTITSVLPL
jgi:hypothetical protein